MSALGQKLTFAPQQGMSALPPIQPQKRTSAKRYVCCAPESGRAAQTVCCFGSLADICSAIGNVRFTPDSDIGCDFWRVCFGQKATLQINWCRLLITLLALLRVLRRELRDLLNHSETGYNLASSTLGRRGCMEWTPAIRSPLPIGSRTARARRRAQRWCLLICVTNLSKPASRSGAWRYSYGLCTRRSWGAASSGSKTSASRSQKDHLTSSKEISSLTARSSRHQIR